MITFPFFLWILWNFVCIPSILKCHHDMSSVWSIFVICTADSSSSTGKYSWIISLITCSSVFSYYVDILPPKLNFPFSYIFSRFSFSIFCSTFKEVSSILIFQCFYWAFSWISVLILSTSKDSFSSKHFFLKWHYVLSCGY